MAQKGFNKASGAYGIFSSLSGFKGLVNTANNTPDVHPIFLDNMYKTCHFYAKLYKSMRCYHERLGIKNET